jgi:hypothetical protein
LAQMPFPACHGQSDPRPLSRTQLISLRPFLAHLFNLFCTGARDELVHTRPMCNMSTLGAGEVRCNNKMWCLSSQRHEYSRVSTAVPSSLQHSMKIFCNMWPSMQEPRPWPLSSSPDGRRFRASWVPSKRKISVASLTFWGKML